MAYNFEKPIHLVFGHPGLAAVIEELVTSLVQLLVPVLIRSDAATDTGNSRFNLDTEGREAFQGGGMNHGSTANCCPAATPCQQENDYQGVG